STLHVLVRSADPAHGKDRLRAGLERAQLLTPALAEAFHQRVRVVSGDLARPLLGLDDSQWRMLADRVQAVVHNAANVNYVLSYDALRAHNVSATRTLLNLAAQGGMRPFHLISSTFIYGWSTKKILWEHDHNPEMEDLDFGYVQTKWVAEQQVLHAARQGLPVRVYRPSLLSASTRGVGSKDDIAIRL